MKEPHSSDRGHAKSYLVLAGLSLAAAGAAIYGSHHTRNGMGDWYDALDKPFFTPPPAVFPVIWSSLYATMAWSAWRVYNAPPSRDRTRALKLWFSQLAANSRWSKLFFGKHRPDLALADSIGLVGLIASYISTAGRVDKAAARAFYPYLAWVGFATLLNAEIVRRNLV
jgi:tryptophan-rich sensory protein